MTLDLLELVVEIVRKVLNKECPNFPHGYCYEFSCLLMKVLKHMGFKAKMLYLPNMKHYLLYLPEENIYIDGTIDQFMETIQFIYTEPLKYLVHDEPIEVDDCIVGNEEELLDKIYKEIYG